MARWAHLPISKKIFKAAKSFVDITSFLKNKLMKLTDETVVHSARGETTIRGRIKLENQLLLA